MQALLYQTCRHLYRLQSVFEDSQETHRRGFPTLGEAGGYRPAKQHLKKHGSNKEKRLHFTASERPALKQKRQQVFSTHQP